MRITEKLRQYKFRDSLQLVSAVIFGNFLLAIILMFPDFTNVWQSTHVWWCLMSALVILALRLAYDWRSFTINIGILVIYLVGVVLEYLQAGLPGTDLIDWENHRISKGVMFDLLVGMLPAFYIAIRVFLGGALLGVALSSRHVE